MMTTYDFNRIVSPLENLFSNISEASIRDMYYGMFKRTDELILERAIAHILDTHRTKTFPLPAEIYDAITFVKSEMVVVDAPGLECPECLGMGHVIKKCQDPAGLEMGYEHAVTCTCQAGRARRRGWNLKDRKISPRRKKT